MAIIKAIYSIQTSSAAAGNEATFIAPGQIAELVGRPLEIALRNGAAVEATEDEILLARAKGQLPADDADTVQEKPARKTKTKAEPKVPEDDGDPDFGV